MKAVESLPTIRESSVLQIGTWSELKERAEYFAQSQLIPQALRGKPHDIAIILQMGMEVGLSQLQSLNGINVIQGKPSVSPEAQLALIRSRCPDAFIKIDMDHVKQTVTVTMARSTSKEHLDQSFTAVWDITRAQKMGYLNKDNYKTQPMVMLKWRAVGEAARTVFSDILKGLYSDEEMAGVSDEGGVNDNASSIKAAFTEKPPEKEVVSDVRAVEPEVLPKEAPQATPISQGFDPLGEYEVKVSQLKGKKLKDFPIQLLKKHVQTARDFYKDKLSGAWLEFVTRAEQYIATFEEPSASEPMFDDFEPGAMG